MQTLTEWHRIVEQGDLAALETLLAEDVTFHSPVVHTPIAGRQMTVMIRPKKAFDLVHRKMAELLAAG